jgi:hypothetical protein
VSGHSVARALATDPTPWSTFLDEKGQRLLTIRAADCDGSRSSAHYLVKRMYAQRGYTTSSLPDHSNPNRITLLASDGGDAIGTISINFDSPNRLLVDELFAAEVRQLRDEGFTLCEFIKLAVDGVVQSKKVLASLMDAAFLCAREVKRCDKALIEVNPRHVRFYESMLGFKVLTRDRMNHRVNAPAVLMSLDLDFADEQVEEAHHADPMAAGGKRSLYCHGFSPEERSGLVNRLRHSYS